MSREELVEQVIDAREKKIRSSVYIWRVHIRAGPKQG